MIRVRKAEQSMPGAWRRRRFASGIPRCMLGKGVGTFAERYILKLRLELSAPHPSVTIRHVGPAVIVNMLRMRQVLIDLVKSVKDLGAIPYVRRLSLASKSSSSCLLLYRTRPSSVEPARRDPSMPPSFIKSGPALFEPEVILLPGASHSRSSRRHSDLRPRRLRLLRHQARCPHRRQCLAHLQSHALQPRFLRLHRRSLCCLDRVHSLKSLARHRAVRDSPLLQYRLPASERWRRRLGDSMKRAGSVALFACQSLRRSSSSGASWRGHREHPYASLRRTRALRVFVPWYTWFTRWSRRNEGGKRRSRRRHLMEAARLRTRNWHA